ncbi:MAG: histidinol-phosphatase [Planctomycetia bacterium]|nr:histidinol-phosphatase [Planctomycetia bacterium]
MSRNTEIQNRLQFAVKMAEKAGENTLKFFQKKNFDVEMKKDESPVTVADKSTEKLMREMIAEAFPNDEILGEEMPLKPGNSGFQWILDPIDGTKAFIHGVPLYGTLVGIVFQEEAVAGVIRIPALGECVYAATGSGAWYQKNGESPVPARVSEVKTLSEALVLTTEEKTLYVSKCGINRYENWKTLMMNARLARNWGDCYGYMLVATGRAEVMIDPEMSVWDTAALMPIILEAGGKFTDWKNVPTYQSGDSVATNGVIHEEVMAALIQN